MNQTGTKQQKSDASVTRVAMNLEVDVIPVSSVERSKEFYQRLGWRLDDDVAPANDVPIVQFTPPEIRLSTVARLRRFRAKAQSSRI
jgi:predicted lactoylglutathione lyase